MAAPLLRTAMAAPLLRTMVLVSSPSKNFGGEFVATLSTLPGGMRIPTQQKSFMSTWRPKFGEVEKQATAENAISKLNFSDTNAGGNFPANSLNRRNLSTGQLTAEELARQAAKEEAIRQSAWEEALREAAREAAFREAAREEALREAAREAARENLAGRQLNIERMFKDTILGRLTLRIMGPFMRYSMIMEECAQHPVLKHLERGVGSVRIWLKFIASGIVIYLGTWAKEVVDEFRSRFKTVDTKLSSDPNEVDKLRTEILVKEKRIKELEFEVAALKMSMAVALWKPHTFTDWTGGHALGPDDMYVSKFVSKAQKAVPEP